MFISKQNNIRWKLLIAATLVVLVAIVLGVLWYDVPVYLFMTQYNYVAWRWFANIFDGKVWLIVFGLATIVMYLKKTYDLRNDPTTHMHWFNIKFLTRDAYAKLKNSNAFLVFCSLVLSGVIVEISKVIIGRARPIFFDEFGIVGFFPGTFEWAFNSMPSGHAALSFAGLVMLGMLMPRFKILTWGLAILIGLSRIAIGAHWPTDVLLGAFIGMVSADVVLSIVRRIK